jgi:hypothetical protein
MRSLLLAGITVGVTVLADALPASAALFDLSFSGTGISGALDLSLASGASPFKVDGATGPLDLGGATYTITGLSSYAGADERAYYPAASSIGYLDFQGVSVETSGGFALNLFAFSPTSYGVVLSSNNPAGDPFNAPYYSVSVTDAPPVPELSTGAMLALGFAGLASVAAAKRKTPIAALG